MSTCFSAGCDRPLFVIKHQACQKHYMAMRSSGQLKQLREAEASRAGMSDTWHRVEETSVDGKTGYCTICGPGIAVMIKVNGRAVCVAGTRESHRRMRYKISPEKLAALLERAGHACQICRDPVNAATLRVDHDHACCPKSKTCGKCVRGILCHRCNVALGFMRDNPANLAAAIAYLDRNSSLVGG